jgi:hypothetical protein
VFNLKTSEFGEMEIAAPGNGCQFKPQTYVQKAIFIFCAIHAVFNLKADKKVLIRLSKIVLKNIKKGSKRPKILC